MPQKYSCSSPWRCWKMRDMSSDARCSKCIPWKHPGQRDKETCCLPGCRLGKQSGCDCIWTPFFWLSLSLPHFRQSADRAVAFPFPHPLHSHPHNSPTLVTLSWPLVKFGVIPTKYDLPPRPCSAGTRAAHRGVNARLVCVVTGSSPSSNCHCFLTVNLKSLPAVQNWYTSNRFGVESSYKSLLIIHLVVAHLNKIMARESLSHSVVFTEHDLPINWKPCRKAGIVSH